LEKIVTNLTNRLLTNKEQLPKIGLSPQLINQIVMKKLITLILSFSVIMLTFTNPAWAGDIDHGAKIFTANCAACHMGGGNVVDSNKTLKKTALEKYGMNDLVAIKNQIMKGKNAMPAFGNKLTAEEIDDVASYVLAQADKGW
jgi:cytochrome c6